MRKLIMALAASLALLGGVVIAAPSASAVVYNGYDTVTFKPWPDEAAKLTITNYPKTYSDGTVGQTAHIAVTGDCCLPRAVSVEKVWINGTLVHSTSTKGTVEKFYSTTNKAATITVKVEWHRGGDLLSFFVTRST